MTSHGITHVTSDCLMLFLKLRHSPFGVYIMKNTFLTQRQLDRLFRYVWVVLCGFFFLVNVNIFLHSFNKGLLT